MKTLEQLGISPAPWRQVANGYGTLDVLGSDDSLVVAYENPINNNDQENRRLIAAAPKLYAACHEMLRYYYEQNTNTTVFNTALEMMKQAVAEAAGESEVEK